jgi:glycosyltransferase involved in cell wall biosynthesis
VLHFRFGEEDKQFICIMVIISNGFSKFHLATAAAEADRRKTLSCFLTGAYPTPLARKILSLPYVRTCLRAQRLTARGESISDSAIRASFASEAVSILGASLHRDAIVVDAFRLYGWMATPHVERAATEGARIYHYRAGFGGASVEAAKKCGMFLLCDHSIAHPATVDALVRNMGRMPLREDTVNVGVFWEYVLRDIERADAVLVNSRFVEDTFRVSGHDRCPNHVIYLGVDDAFLDQVPQRVSASGDFRVLFAGYFEKRKGAEIVMDALERIGNLPLQLEIAGRVSPEIADRARIFFSNPRVKYLGLLSRKDLALAMSRAEVFIFPSFAEGSARVVFEALACGCYVVTTPNSGSIVEDGVHGAIVPPGDSNSLAEAIEFAYQHRSAVADIGRSNALCVRSNYRQCNYGDELATLYGQLLNGSRTI